MKDLLGLQFEKDRVGYMMGLLLCYLMLKKLQFPMNIYVEINV